MALIILTLVFIFCWWFIGKRPELFVRIFPYAQKRYLTDETLHVFSAETPNGKEAELVNEGLPERDKVIRFFRLALLAVFLLIMVYLLFVH